MFQIETEELDSLIFQIGISKNGRGGRRTLPYVFTEQGVAMLSGILNSKRAIEVNIGIMRAFVGMRAMIATAKEINSKLSEIEEKLGKHNERFKKVFTALRLLMPPVKQEEKKIGFITKK